MTLKIEFETGNSAFMNDREISRILMRIGNEIENGFRKGQIRDTNGQLVGSYELKG